MPADVRQVRRAFDQVGHHLQVLGKTVNANVQVMQQGFFANDIWMECLKRALDDVAMGTPRLRTRQEDAGDRAIEEAEGLDWESYWKDAHDFVMEKAKEQERARLARQEAEDAAAKEQDEEVNEAEEAADLIEFGGDYARPEEQEEGTGEAGEGLERGGGED